MYVSQLQSQPEREGGTSVSPASRVSVVIVSYWTGPLLIRSVMSAFRQPDVHEVIVVDNGNWADQMDRLVLLTGEDSDRLTVISGHGNIGFAAGCNLGAEQATGDYLFILNPDAILPDGAVEDLLKEAAALEGDWLLGGRLTNPDGTEQAGSRRSPLTPWTAFVEMTQLYRFAPKHPYFRRFNRHEEPCPGEICKTPVISGACMLMKQETFHRVGGMDENYFLHVEDVDFCLRLREAGGEVYFAPKTDIIHFKSSSRANRLRVEAMKAKSLVRYFWTHFKEPYPDIFLALVSGLVWLAFGVKALGILAKRFLSFAGFRARAGRGGMRRAYNIAGKRRNR